jgi:hypothetical protein
MLNGENKKKTCLQIAAWACGSKENYNLHAGKRRSEHAEMKLVVLRMLSAEMASMRK